MRRPCVCNAAKKRRGSDAVEKKNKKIREHKCAAKFAKQRWRLLPSSQTHTINSRCLGVTFTRRHTHTQKKRNKNIQVQQTISVHSLIHPAFPLAQWLRQLDHNGRYRVMALEKHRDNLSLSMYYAVSQMVSKVLRDERLCRAWRGTNEPSGVQSMKADRCHLMVRTVIDLYTTVAESSTFS